ATANLTLSTGLMIWLGQAGMADLDVLELQAFLLSLSTAGLLLGAALSDERKARGQLREQESRYQQVQRRREVAEAMHDIVAMINSESSLSEVLAAVAHQASDLLETDAVGLFLLDEDEQMLSIEASWGISGDFQDDLRLPVGSGAVGQAVQERRPTVVRDLAAMVAEDESRWGSLDAAERTGWFLQHFKTILAVPLLAKRRTLGGMSLYYTSSREISSQDISLAFSFANQAALALENARLHGEARELAVLRERQRLARELHDSVTQALYGISLGARTARSRWEQQQSNLDEPLEYIQSLADAGLAEMRALIFELRPESLEAEGLRAALERMARGVAARHDLELDLDLSEEPDVPLNVKETFYRLAQEALNNIQKHAHGSRFTVRLDREGEKLHMSIADNGVGFDPSAAFPGHLGLHSMRERAEQIGADLEIDSHQNEGTSVQVSWAPTTVDRRDS
ncbi:MAG: GAF domain-containing sensor histidine kinase, partial [Anaerolineales bacterium]|nr:GAF domain-containing sensor histidine kinase [Anaerolineales bacterium]